MRVYAEAADARVGHLRTKSTEHEIDLITERSDRSIVAIEIKLGASVDDRDVRHLRWLRAQLPDRAPGSLSKPSGFTYWSPIR